ncbi:MAG: hypothetical protein MUE83_09785 [Tabrizicola sp.]|jgi:hypothetical protein|nr:hypothetical protein [Tabrizicola sp.]
MRLALALCAVGQAAVAQTPMPPEDFDAWSLGKTLDYSVAGQVYGSEAYFPNRRVRDADTGGPCRDGYWYADGDAVCFVYPPDAGAHCWLYWRDGETVFAKPVTAGPDEAAQTVTEAAGPLACPGPQVGV